MAALTTDVVKGLTYLLSSSAFSHVLSAMPQDEQVRAWVVLDWLGKILEERKKELRDHLLVYASAGIQKTENTKMVVINGTEVRAENHYAKLPKEEPFKQLLIEKLIPITEAFTEVVALVMDPSKIQNLIDTGKIDKADYEALKGVTTYLKVRAAKPLQEALETIPTGPASDSL